MKFKIHIFLLFILINCPLIIFGQLVENLGFLPTGDHLIVTGNKYRLIQTESKEIPSSKKNSFFTNIYAIDEAGNITERIHFVFKPRSEQRTLAKDIYSYDENNRLKSWSRWTPKRKFKLKKNPKKKDKIIKKVQAIKWAKEVRTETYEYDSLGIMVKMNIKINDQINTVQFLNKHIVSGNKKIITRYSYDEKTSVLLDSFVFIKDNFYHFKPDQFPGFTGRKIDNPYLYKMKYYNHDRERYLTRTIFTYESDVIFEFNQKGFPIMVSRKKPNVLRRYFYDKNGFFSKISVFEEENLIKDIFFEKLGPGN